MLRCVPADISSITRVGQYFSIDSRPVSCGRGTLKTISGLYKSYLRSAWAKDNGDKINDPFICMNIVCPPGSYDANIEPAKDDVLFTDASKVLEIAESFLKNVYGELQWPSKAPGDSGRAMSRSQGFDALLARKPHPVAIPKSQHHPLELAKNNIHGDSDAVLDISPVSSTVTGNGAGLVPEIETSIEDGSAYSMPEGTGLSALGNPSPDKVGRPNMYAADDDDEMNLFVAQDHHGSRPQTPVAEDEAGLRDVRVSNPWSIAKVNAASRPHLRQQSNVGQLMTPVRTREDHQAGDHGTSPMTTIGDTQPFPQTLPTPLQSLRDSSDRRTASSSPERFPYPLSARNSRSGEHALQMHRAANKERYGGGALDTWVQKSINGYIDAPSSEAEPEKDLITVPESDTQTRDFISARLLPTGTPLSAIPTPPTRPRRQSPQKQTGKVVQKPFTSPLTDDSVWFDVGQGPKSRRPPPDRIKGKQSTFTPQGRLQLSPSATTTSSPERRAQPKLSSSSRLPSPTTTSSSPDHPVHPDLASSLEYETRKAIASQQHRASLLLQKRQKLASDAKATGHRGTSNSPHQNRYNRAVAALHQEDQASTKGHQSPQKKSVFEAGDPRQYWMRVQEREQVLAAADGNISPSRIPSAKRRKTAMLPLEVVREEWSVRDLVLPLPPIDLSTLASGVKATRKLDEYISSGTTTTNLVLNSAQIFHTVRAWEEQLRTLVHDTYKIVGTDSQPAQLRVELWPLLQEHATKYPSSNAAVMEKDAAENT